MAAMIINSSTYESLMMWAREQAPFGQIWGITSSMFRRRVRIEISAEDQWVDRSGVRYLTPVDRVVARVYLAEPRCIWPDIDMKHDDECCECGPLAEKRIG